MAVYFIQVFCEILLYYSCNYVLRKNKTFHVTDINGIYISDFDSRKDHFARKFVRILRVAN